MPNLNYYILQKAIYEKLIASSPLMAIINGVFDNVPQGTPYPFVVINHASCIDLSNLENNCSEHKIDINIWSREAGKKQISDIMDVIYGLLHNGTIAVFGHSLISMGFTTNSISLSDDGWTYCGVMSLRVVLSEN